MLKIVKNRILGILFKINSNESSNEEISEKEKFRSKEKKINQAKLRSLPRVL
jgi:hypothetical protein